MDDNNNGLICALGGWGLAILAGILGAVLLMLLGDWRLIQAIFACIVITVFIGCLMMWIICRPLPPQGAIPASVASTNPTPSNEESAAKAAEAARSGAVASAPEGTPAAAAAAAKAGVKPSTPLAGEAELAARKGSWTYSKDSETTTTTSSAPAAPAQAEDPEPDAAAAPEDTGVALTENDPDATPETEESLADTAEKAPEILDAPRSGQADDLKKIKGVGPGLEKTLNELGFWHFAQIAEWGEREVAWVDARLKFKGRIKRDDWITQAKSLAKGDEA